MPNHSRALATVSKDNSPIPSTHMAVYSHLYFQSQGIQCPLLASVDPRYTYVSYTHAHTHTNNSLQFMFYISEILSFVITQRNIHSLENRQGSGEVENHLFLAVFLQHLQPLPQQRQAWTFLPWLTPSACKNLLAGKKEDLHQFPAMGGIKTHSVGFLSLAMRKYETSKQEGREEGKEGGREEKKEGGWIWFGSQFQGIEPIIMGNQQRGLQLWEWEVVGYILSPVRNLGDESKSSQIDSEDQPLPGCSAMDYLTMEKGFLGVLIQTPVENTRML